MVGFHYSGEKPRKGNMNNLNNKILEHFFEVFQKKF